MEHENRREDKMEAGTWEQDWSEDNNTVSCMGELLLCYEGSDKQVEREGLIVHRAPLTNWAGLEL